MIKQLLKETDMVSGVENNKNREKYEKFADKIVYTGKIDEYFGFKFENCNIKLKDGKMK